MRLYCRHSWNLSPKKAIALQERLRRRIVFQRGPALSRMKLVAGLDVSYSKPTDRCYAAVTVMRLPDFAIMEERTAAVASPFPYIPGLLSFREIPPLIAALRRLRLRPDAFILDGQGIAHPRRLGLATHVGILYDVPTVGCAKTRLCGEYEEPAAKRGSWSALRDEKTGEIIGSALRTRNGVKPVFASVGNHCDDAFARRLILSLTAGWRLPEPIRRAHQLSNEARRLHEG